MLLRRLSDLSAPLSTLVPDFELLIHLWTSTYGLLVPKQTQQAALSFQNVAAAFSELILFTMIKIPIGVQVKSCADTKCILL